MALKTVSTDIELSSIYILFYWLGHYQIYEYNSSRSPLRNAFLHEIVKDPKYNWYEMIERF